MDQEDKKEVEQKQHVCRFCNKSFANGKVLGGHMRCHVAKNPISNKKNKKKKRGSSEALSKIKSYGLRVNPKKSSRVISLSIDREKSPLMVEELPCRICGKAFDSMRALFGHMRHHSTKIKKEKETSFEDLAIAEKLFIESSGFAKKKRSRRTRQIINKGSNSSSLVTITDCSVSNNSSSLVVADDFDDPEAEEIALCLLMLSKGIRESPEEFLTKKPRLEDEAFGGFLEDKKLPQFSEKDNEGKESLKLMMISSEEASDPKTFFENEIVNNTMIIEYKCRTCDKIFNSHQALGGHQTIHRPNKACQASILIEDFEAKLEESAENSKQHKCPICSKVFSSGQALGGHKRAHMIKENEAYEQEKEHIELTSLVDSDNAKLESSCPWWVINSHHKREFLVGLVPN